MQYYYEDAALRGGVKLDLRLGYLSVPVLLQLKMGDRNSYFHFDGGVVFNQLVYTKYTGTIAAEDDQGNTADQDFDLEADPYQQDFGYTFGIGLVANGLLNDLLDAVKVGNRELNINNAGIDIGRFTGMIHIGLGSVGKRIFYKESTMLKQRK